MNMPLRKPEGISWNPATVELPDIPTIPAGQDALSATISAVLPTLATPLAANVATLQAKEAMFSGKVGAAQVAYQNSDEAGSQSVGQIVGALGQLGQQAGQMGQMAGAPAQAVGGQAGMFGSLMQQAMQGAQGGGGTQGAPTQGAPATGQGPAPAPGAPTAAGQAQPRDERVDTGESQVADDTRREEREKLLRADDSRPTSGPVPVTPPERQSPDDGLERRL